MARGVVHPRLTTRRSTAIGATVTSGIGESLQVVKKLKDLMDGLPPLSSRTPGEKSEL